MQLETGKSYVAKKVFEPFEDIDGSIVKFEDDIKNITVLEKPEYVYCDDELVHLPEHLSSDDWIFYLNIDSGKRYFMSVKYVDFTEIK